MTANIHSKLNTMRCEFLSRSHKKTGKNAFAKYNYFELADFMPSVLGLCNQLGICGIFSVEDGVATLTLVNTESVDQTIKFTAPFGSCELKGCHEAQNVGSSITYSRRYLWGMALELIENDAIDASEPIKTPAKATKVEAKPAPVEVNKVLEAMRKAGNIETLERYYAKAKERATPEQMVDIDGVYNELKPIYQQFKEEGFN